MWCVHCELRKYLSLIRKLCLLKNYCSTCTIEFEGLMLVGVYISWKYFYCVSKEEHRTIVHVSSWRGPYFSLNRGCRWTFALRAFPMGAHEVSWHLASHSHILAQTNTGSTTKNHHQFGTSNRAHFGEAFAAESLCVLDETSSFAVKNSKIYYNNIFWDKLCSVHLFLWKKNLLWNT